MGVHVLSLNNLWTSGCGPHLGAESSFGVLLNTSPFLLFNTSLFLYEPLHILKLAVADGDGTGRPLCLDQLYQISRSLPSRPACRG